ncbi:UNVERIFIED_CONTAM: hypothetical protein GTU68_038734 [Idotea baltica]|nr:hypothetical protein [Idotea baltica]
MGTVKEDYLKVFPPNSFIHVQDFSTVQELAEYITYLSKNKVAYNKYHQWRTKYQIVNEHGYFQTKIFHYCRLCEALNYNSQSPKSYTSMKAFWNVSRDCNLNTFPLPAKKGSESTNL